MASVNVDETTLQAALERLIQTNRALVHAGKPAEVLQAIVDYVVGDDIDYASLWTITADLLTVEVAAEWDRTADGDKLIGTRLPLEDVLPPRSDGQASPRFSTAPVYTSDLTEDNDCAIPPRLKTFLVDQRHLRAVALFPLAVSEQPVGLLLVAGHKPHIWTTGKRQTYLAISDHVATVVRGLQLMQRGQASVVSALSERDRVALLLQSTQELSADLDLTTIMNTLIDFAPRVRAEIADVYLIEDAGLAYFASTATVGADLSESDVQTIVENLYDKVFQSSSSHHNETIVIGHTQADERWQAVNHPALQKNDLSVVCVSLRFGKGRALGAVIFSHSEANHFSEDDVATIQALAAQATTAISNALLLGDVQRSLNESQILLDISRELSSSLDKEAVYKSAVQAFMATGADGCALAVVDTYQDDVPTWSEVVALVDRHDVTAYHNHVGKRFHLPDYPTLRHLAIEHIPVIIHNALHDRVLIESERQILVDAGIQALVVLPLISRGQVIGYVLAARRQPYFFTDREIALYRTIVNQVTISVEHAWQLEEMRHRTTQLTTAAEVSQLASRILDPDELIEKVVTIIGDAFNFYYVGLFLVEEVGEAGESQAVLKAGTGEAGRAQVEAGHKLLVGGDSMIGQCIARGHVQVDLDVDEDAVRFVNPYLPQTRSEMALPLSSRNQVIGALTVQSTQAAAFSADDIRVLQTMVDQVAIAIENARLFATVNLALEETNTLYTISRRIAAAQTAKKIGDIIIDAVPKTSYDHVILVLKDDPHDPENTWVEVISGWDRRVPPQDFLGNRYSSQMAPILSSPQVNEVIVEPDVAHGDSLDERTRDFLTQLGIKSVAMVPLFAGKRLLGWLMAETTGQPRSFTDNDVRFLQLLADQAGISLGRLQAIESLLESREQYLTVVDNIPGAVYRRLPDENYTIFYINEEIHTLTGYHPEAFGPENEIAFADLIHPDDRPYIADSISRRVSLRQPYEIEFRLVDRYGTVKHVLERGRGVFNEPDELIYLDGIIFDISERRTLELALERRAVQLESAAEVGRIASSILDVETLIDRAVELIGQRFDLYYVGLFLVDEVKQWAVLQAGTGEAGQLQVARGHRLAVGGESMIGSCVATGQPRLAHNIEEETDFFANPYLPETRSEMALPLQSRGEAIGALTVQSEKEAAFSQEDVDTLQLMADLLANAIANARLFQQTQEALQEAGLLYTATGQLLTARSEDDVCTAALNAIGQTGIHSASIQMFVVQNGEQWLEQRGVWLHRGQPAFPVGTRFSPSELEIEHLLLDEDLIIIQDVASDKRLSASFRQLLLSHRVASLLVVPLVSRDMRLGLLLAAYESTDPIFSERQIRFYQAIGQQMVVALQNLRLLRESQRRARNEQIVREINGKIMGATNPAQVMKMLVEELGKALDTPYGVARLGVNLDLPSTSRPAPPPPRNRPGRKHTHDRDGGK